jgi:hypothetical protein
MDFEVVGDLTDVETIAAGRSIRELPRLRRLYGKGRWRKMKGVGRIRLRDGRIRLAELHWLGDGRSRELAQKDRKIPSVLDLRLAPVTPEVAGSSPVDPATLQFRFPGTAGRLAWMTQHRNERRR